MEGLKLVIFDGGGTIWYSMDVLWEHYKAGFFYFGLTRKLDGFPYSLQTSNELASLPRYNSRRNMAKGLVALFKSGKNPEEVLSSTDPSRQLDLLVDACTKGPHVGSDFERTCASLGLFLEEALYNYDERRYPACRNVLEALRQLRARGLRLTLLSNRRKASVEKILHALNLYDLFETIEAPEYSERATKNVTSALKTLDLPPEKAVFVGDSTIDISSAKQCGVTTVGVLSGFGTLRTLRRAGADYILEDAGELIDKVISKLNIDMEGCNDVSTEKHRPGH